MTIDLQQQQRHWQIAQRWQYGSVSRHSCHFSGKFGGCRRPKISIQRFLPGLPPVISAEVLQILQQMQ
jgi:hypothetical protein